MARGLGSGQVSRVESLIEVHRGWARKPGSGSSAAAPPRFLAAPGGGARGAIDGDALLPRPHWPAGKPLTQEDPCLSLLCGLLGGASRAESLVHPWQSKREGVQGCNFDLSVERSQLIVSTPLVL